jgi:8-oxo-dGTP diphosphatase
MTKLVHVAVGVVYQQQQVFVTRRAEHVHQGGKWEFPGGKVESGETVAEALARELREEIAIEVLACSPLMMIEHDYGDKKVQLDVFLVDHFTGEPAAQEGQQQKWAAISTLADLDFPEANLAIIEKIIQLLVPA